MSSPTRIELQATATEVGLRIDKFLHARLPDYSRNFLQKLIADGFVRVGEQFVKASYRLNSDDKISLTIPPPQPTELLAENIPIEIVYQDEALLVVNKPAGLVVHPGAGVRSGTLVNALLYHCRQLSDVGAPLRPGIVHRLDKNTSGLLVVAKTNIAHQRLSQQFAEKSAFREYLVLVWGNLENEEGTIDTLLNRSKRDRKMFAVAAQGKRAVTNFRVKQRFPFLTLVSVRLLTGRTHQIRIHFNYLHHPVFGDPEYHGRIKQLGRLENQTDRQFAKHLLQLMPRQALHAQQLGFLHPITGEQMHFHSEPPADFQAVLNELTAAAGK